MHFKTFFVLSLACSFILTLSNSLYAYEFEEASPGDNSDFTTSEFSEPLNDQAFGDEREDNGIEDNNSAVNYEFYQAPQVVSGHPNYAARLAKNISPPGEKIIIVNPRTHVWGAYSESGKLLRAGLATAGAKWCSDTGRSCRTKTGMFRIYSLGDSDCVSSIYPVGEGGAPMPYCMFFNGGQGLHGSDHLAEGNLSHGCVRISVNDAQWLRYHFAQKGTKVVIKSY